MVGLAKIRKAIGGKTSSKYEGRRKTITASPSCPSVTNSPSHIALLPRRLGNTFSFSDWGVGEDNCVCEKLGIFSRLRTWVLVNVLGFNCFCSNLAVKDTLHHPEPEEGVIASLDWAHTHHLFLRGEEDTLQLLKVGGEHITAS